MAEHLNLADEHLDLASRDFRVDQLGRARLDRTVDADTPFGADLFDLGEGRGIRVADQLRHAVMIAQVDEQDAAVVAYAVDPPRQANAIPHVIGVEFGAGLASVGVHGGPFRWANVARSYTAHSP